MCNKSDNNPFYSAILRNRYVCMEVCMECGIAHLAFCGLHEGCLETKRQMDVCQQVQEVLALHASDTHTRRHTHT